jgi:hypothetical protein
LPGQPAAQHREIEIAGVGPAHAGRVVEQAGDVADVGPHGVRGAAELGGQVLLEPGQQGPACG